MDIEEYKEKINMWLDDDPESIKEFFKTENAMVIIEKEYHKHYVEEDDGDFDAWRAYSKTRDVMRRFFIK